MSLSATADYLMVRRWLKNEDEPFFVFYDRTPVRPENMRKTLKNALKRTGFNEKLYSTHSLRSGRSVDLANFNLSIETIRKIGRWKSNSIYTYLSYFSKFVLNILSVSEEIQAFQEVWIAGNAFLKEIFPTFNAICRETHVSKRTPPYLQEEFNVEALYMNTFNNVRSTVARIVNVVLQQMNKTVKLPKYLIVIPDKDLAVYADMFEYGAVSCMKDLLKFVVKEINKYIDARFEDLYRKKPGSVRKGEPKVIWVKIVDRIVLKHDKIQAHAKDLMSC